MEQAGMGPLPPDEERLWVHYLENYALPYNRKIVELIEDNVHLIDADGFPESFRDFLDYATGFELLHRQYKDLGREYGFHHTFSYPKQFTRDIMSKLSELKRRQHEMMEKTRDAT